MYYDLDSRDNRNDSKVFRYMDLEYGDNGLLQSRSKCATLHTQSVYRHTRNSLKQNK